MKFLETKDLICGRRIALNLQGVDINYVEAVGPKVSVIHFGKGGIVKVPLSKDYIVAQLLDANAPNYMMVNPLYQPTLTKEDIELRQILKDGAALMEAGGERRKTTTDRRSTSVLEKHPEKSKSKDDDK